MNSMLILKEKDAERVVYNYSSDVTDFDDFEAPISDGEIECFLQTKEFKTLKTATFDDDGYRAKWLRQHLLRVIFKENCPKKRFIATG